MNILELYDSYFVDFFFPERTLLLLPVASLFSLMP